MPALALLPATLAQRHWACRTHSSSRGDHLDLGGVRRRAGPNTGDKHADAGRLRAGWRRLQSTMPIALRAGGTVGVLGCVVKAPSTLGAFTAQFSLGPRPSTRPASSRELLARKPGEALGP